jgi:hypothetical protein
MRCRWCSRPHSLAGKDRRGPAQGQDYDDQDGQLKVMELRRSGGIAAGVSDETECYGVNRDSHVGVRLEVEGGRYTRRPMSVRHLYAI